MELHHQTAAVSNSVAVIFAPVLSRVSASQVSILGTDWTVTEIAGQPVELQRPPTLSFAEDGKIAAFGGCNRFFGGYEASSDTLALSENMAGTLMACPKDVSATERGFLDALGVASGLSSDGQTLTLRDKAGTVVLRAQAGL